MKRRTAKALASIGIVVMILGLFFYIYEFPHTKNIYLAVLTTTAFSFSKGEYVEGDFTVSGGNEKVEFSVKDPYGTVIYDAIANSRLAFVFTTIYEGVYSFVFVNLESTPKTIFLSVQMPAISGGLSLLLVGIGALILSIGLFGYFREKRKQSGKTETQTLHSPPSSSLVSSHKIPFRFSYNFSALV
jgi:hypothetical protein